MDGTFPRWKAYLIAASTLLAPGLGHLALGRRGRAVVFFFLVACMFGLGLALDGALFGFGEASLLYRLAAVGQAGMGPAYVLGRLLGWGASEPGRAAGLMFGYGNTCLVSAGLMNMLLMMDAFDIAVGRKP
jgi:hypothetical protein